jgi:hypothetical protein
MLNLKKMKILTKITLFFISIFSFGQTVTTIEPLGTTLSFEVENGTYLKDLYGEYLPYVGTWKGIKNGKEYTFIFQIFNQHLYTQPNGDYLFKDVLLVKYEVKNILTNSVLYTTMSASNFDDFPILALSTPFADGRQNFYFTDSAAHCYNTLTFSLTKIVDNPNQLKYGSFNYAEFWDYENCPNYPERTNIPVPIPTSGLIFYKQ